MISKSTAALSIRVAKPDVILIGQLIELTDGEHKKQLQKLLEKMERAIIRITHERGLAITRFFSIAQEHLGDRLIMPPSPGPGWYTKLTNKLKEVGIKHESEARVIAIYASRFLRPGTNLTAERLVQNASEYLGLARKTGLLAEANGPLPLESE